MKIAHMFDVFPNDWRSTNNTSAITVGLKFRFKSPGVISHLSWYRVGSGEADGIQHIGLWDTVTESFVYQTAAPEDDLFHGSQWVDLPSPVAVTDGRDYVLMARYPAGSKRMKIDLPNANLPISPPGFLLSGPPYVGLETTSAWPAVPGTANPDVITPLDAGFSIFAPDTTTPLTEYTLEKHLSDWFAPAGYGMPVGANQGYVSRSLLQSLFNPVSTADIATAVLGGEGVQVSTLSDYEHAQWDASAADVASILGFLGTLVTIGNYLRDLWPTGHLPSDHEAELQAHRAATEPEGETLPSYIEGEIEIVLSAVTDQTNEITQILAHGNGTEDVPTIVGESDWGNIFRFDVPADFYTVDITTTDVDATAEDVAGTQVWDHLGFCIPLTVDGLPEYGPRLAIGGQIIRTGRQMGGIILNGRRVLSGHVTAYKYQPA